MTFDEIHKAERENGLFDTDNVETRVRWVNALRAAVAKRMPTNKSGVALVSDIDLILATVDERAAALMAIKPKPEPRTFTVWLTPRGTMYLLSEVPAGEEDMRWERITVQEVVK